MTIGSSNRVDLRRVAESVMGQVPATPLWVPTRFTGEGLNYTINNTTSNEIRSDRQTSDLVQTSAEAAGNVDFELAYGAYDDLLAAALLASSAAVTVSISAAVDIAVDATNSQYDSTTTNFVTEGVVVGMWLRVAGFTTSANNGLRRVTAVATDSVTVEDPGSTLVDEIAGDAINIDANMRRNGVYERSFTFGKVINDIATPSYLNYLGFALNQMSLEAQTGNILTGSFDFMGMSSTISDSDVAGATVDTANTNSPMNAVNDLINFIDNGSPSTMQFQNLSLNINNNYRAVDAIGSLGHVAIRPGRLEVTGSVGVYYEDRTQYDRFLAGTEFSLSFMAQDPDATGDQYLYVITLPSIKFSSGTLVAGGLDSDMVFESEFTAFMNAAQSTTIQIDTFGAAV